MRIQQQAMNDSHVAMSGLKMLQSTENTDIENLYTNRVTAFSPVDCYAIPTSCFQVHAQDKTCGETVK